MTGENLRRYNYRGDEMRIHIGKIRGKRGAYLEFRFREEFASPWEMKDARLGGPVDFSGRVTNTGKGYLVEGLVEAEATFPCDRCLDLFPVKIQNGVQEEFHSRPPWIATMTMKMRKTTAGRNCQTPRSGTFFTETLFPWRRSSGITWSSRCRRSFCAVPTAGASVPDAVKT